MKKSILSLLIFSFILCGCKNTTPLSNKEFCLDTIIQITLYDSSSKNILNNCFDLCKKYERIFSANNKKSELYKINHSSNKLEAQELSDDLYKVIKQGLYYSDLSKGSFDITIGSISSLWDFKKHTLPEDPLIQHHLHDVSYKNIILENHKIRFLNTETMIDLGAIAKGYIADQIKNYLLKENVKSALINLGGNILCVGKKQENPFIIGVTNPQQTSDSLFSLKINDLSVVTSGTYQRFFEIDSKRYHHILNPKTGYPYETDIAGVSIIADNSIDADALSTLTFTKGVKEGLKFVENLDNVDAIFITNDKKIYLTENIKDNFKLMSNDFEISN